jgi:hypothetical protein
VALKVIEEVFRVVAVSVVACRHAWVARLGFPELDKNFSPGEKRVVATIAEAIVGKLIGSGLARLGDLVFQKMIRLQRVDDSLRGIIITDPLAKKAIADFEIVMGAYRGELTQRLHDFLGELEKSGLINSLIENALFERKSAEVKHAFIRLHTDVMELPNAEADVLYERLSTAFEVTLKELCKDKVLLQFVKSAHSEVISRLDRIDQALSAADKIIVAKVDTLRFGSLQPLLVKLARGLQLSLKNIRIETNKGARSVDITRIFIPPKLGFRENDQNTFRLNAAAKVFESGKVRQDGRSRASQHELFQEASRGAERECFNM